MEENEGLWGSSSLDLEKKEQKMMEDLAKIVESLSQNELAWAIENDVNTLLTNAENDLRKCSEYFAIPSDVTEEFINEIWKQWKEKLLSKEIDDTTLVAIFGEDVLKVRSNPMFKNIFHSEIKYFVILYYLKKLSPEHYTEYMEHAYNILVWFAEDPDMLNTHIKTTAQAFEAVYSFIKSNWDKALSYLKYCSASDWSYLRNSTQPMVEHTVTELVEMRRKNDEKERLIHERIAALDGKPSNNTWEQVEVEIPDYDSFADEKRDEYQLMYEWFGSSIQFFETFIDEPEWKNLFDYLKDYPQKLSNLWWKEIKEIDLNTEKWVNFCFHWILSMVRSRPDIDFPHLPDNPSLEDRESWSNQWWKIIKEYEKVLRDYISLDFTTNEVWERVEKPREQTFDKIFYIAQNWDSIVDRFKIWKDILSWLTTSEVSDFSYQSSNNEDVKKDNAYAKMDEFADELRDYIAKNPDKKILICINDHWNPDGSSENEMGKEEWLTLANMSENINIWSVRCYFWTAFEKDQITQNRSSVSWFSNHSPTLWPVTLLVDEANKKNLWYHEMEIYTRLNYISSVSPLTESLPYTNWNTWETEVWKIWIAQNNGIPENTDALDLA